MDKPVSRLKTAPLGFLVDEDGKVRRWSPVAFLCGGLPSSPSVANNRMLQTLPVLLAALTCPHCSNVTLDPEQVLPLPTCSKGSAPNSIDCLRLTVEAFGARGKVFGTDHTGLPRIDYRKRVLSVRSSRILENPGPVSGIHNCTIFLTSQFGNFRASQLVTPSGPMSDTEILVNMTLSAGEATSFFCFSRAMGFAIQVLCAIVLFLIASRFSENGLLVVSLVSTGLFAFAIRKWSCALGLAADMGMALAVVAISRKGFELLKATLSAITAGRGLLSRFRSRVLVVWRSRA